MGPFPLNSFPDQHVSMQEKSAVASSILLAGWSTEPRIEIDDERHHGFMASSLALIESLEETKWEPMQCKQPYHGSLCICRGTERRTATGKLFRRYRRWRACSLIDRS
jgi:hypothetical protein